MPIMNTLQTARPAALGLALAMALGLGACDTVTEAADDARQVVEEGVGLAQYCVAAADLARAMNNEDLPAAVAAGEDMVQHAPDEIAAEAEFLLAAAREAQDGNPDRLRSQEGQQALDEVVRFTQERCDPR